MNRSAVRGDWVIYWSSHTHRSQKSSLGTVEGRHGGPIGWTKNREGLSHLLGPAHDGSIMFCFSVSIKFKGPISRVRVDQPKFFIQFQYSGYTRDGTQQLTMDIYFQFLNDITRAIIDQKPDHSGSLFLCPYFY